MTEPVPDTVANHEAEADRIWGPGNWIVCETCPRDHFDHPIRHHKDAHG